MLAIWTFVIAMGYLRPRRRWRVNQSLMPPTLAGFPAKLPYRLPVAICGWSWVSSPTG
jgi:hypothetical protein